MEQLITRHDTGLGDGEYDSIAWAFEVHVEQPDKPNVLSGVMYGDETCPEGFDFFDTAEPTVDSKPVVTWRNRNAVWLNR